MGTPLVSIIIPTYNRASVIAHTIENVFAQSYRNMELIIVDDGSSDDTQKVLRRFGDRIRLISQQNSGPAVARNRGAAIARGDIIAFQDSDDLWKPTKIERQVALLEKLGPTVPCCLCNAQVSVANGAQYTSFEDSLIFPTRDEGLWLNVPEVLATRFVLFNQTAAIRRKAWQKIGGFAEDLKYLEDYDLPLRLALEGPWGFVREPLVIYREDSSESFHTRAARDAIVLKQCQLTIIDRMLARVAEDTSRGQLRKHLTRRVRSVRRQLLAIRWRHSATLAKRTAGTLLMTIDRCRMAAFRRSPCFPKALTVPAGARDVSQMNV
jgi:glycosyltransferase involved in cell wall biosynthesis